MQVLTCKGVLFICDKIPNVWDFGAGSFQIMFAAHFGMSKQTMSNKFARNSWFATDLVKAANFCGCKLAFILPDGQQIIIEDDGSETKKDPDAK